MDAATLTMPSPSGEPMGGKRSGRHPGVIVSLLVHALVAFLLLYRIDEVRDFPPVVPVEVVPLGLETTPPPAAGTTGQERQAALQQQRPRPPSRREQANPNPPSRVAPSKSQEPTNDVPAPPRDELQAKLEELAKLTQPQTDPRAFEGFDAPGRSATGNGRGGPAPTYSVKDFIRAQVERRWNLDLETLGGRNLVISIHVVLKRDGSVAKAEIVNNSGYGGDELYRNIAISARNAVILSSPFALPSGSYETVKDMVLDLNPRDTVR